MPGLFERVLTGIARRGGSPAERLLSRPAIRSWLQRRAQAAWVAADAPLILCYGNINRSPYAQAVANGRAGAHASSAGFHAASGRPAAAATVAYAAREGVDLDGHRSATVSRKQIARARAVFVFDLENVATLLARSPCALTRTHLIGALGSHGAVLITDPHGHDEATLHATLHQIRTVIDDADHHRA